jgi:FixJ family two-component response regulator
MSAEPTVHVVDDDAAVCRSLERLLDAAGFRVVSYDLPLAFLEAARACRQAASCSTCACREWTGWKCRPDSSGSESPCR